MGRPAGSKNTFTRDQERRIGELLSKYGDPLEILFKVAFQKGEFKNNKDVSLEMRIACALRASEFTWAKRRAFEMQQVERDPIQISWLDAEGEGSVIDHVPENEPVTIQQMQ